MLEVGKRYESPRTGTWVKIAERSGGNLTFEHPMKASERRRALVSWRIVNPVARSLAGIAPWWAVPLDEAILRRFSHYARLGERTMGIEPRLLKIELDPS